MVYCIGDGYINTTNSTLSATHFVSDIRPQQCWANINITSTIKKIMNSVVLVMLLNKNVTIAPNIYTSIRCKISTIGLKSNNMSVGDVFVQMSSFCTVERISGSSYTG